MIAQTHFLLFLHLLAQAGGAPSLRLLIDDLSNPLDASPSPQFTWTLPSTPPSRNISQTSYRLCLSTLPAGGCEVYDSGLVPSPSTVAVTGPTGLSPGSLLFAIVASHYLVDGASTPTTSSSPPQRFAVGLPSRADWSVGAEFVGLGGAAPGACPWLRTTFTLSALDAAAVAEGAASALLHVASVGYHEPFVNGIRLEPGAVLLPSVSDLGARVPSRTYDVSLALRAGVNALGLWLAPGWGAFEGVNPVMNFNLSGVTAVAMAELRVASTRTGTPLVVVLTNASSSSWKARASTTTHLGAWTNSNFGGDAVDYTADAPGWATPSFDDSGWAGAEEVSIPGRAVTPEAIEPTGVIGSVGAASVAPCTGTAAAGGGTAWGAQGNATGCWVVTMGDIFVGWLNVSGLKPLVPGGEVVVSYSESGEGAEYTQVDTVRGAIDATELSFCGRFSYHAARFVTLQGLSSPPSLAHITGLRLMNTRERSGSFASASPLLNDIYAAMARTYEGLNTGGMTVDCPHRERLGYGGDAHTHLEFALATYPSASFLRKWLRDWGDVKGWDGEPGMLPHTAPTVDGGGGPGWGGFAVVAPWQSFLVNGNVGALGEAWPIGRAFLEALWGHVSAAPAAPAAAAAAGGGVHGPPLLLLQPFGGSWGFLGDWLTPHGSEQSDSREALLFNNCYFVYILRLGVRIATALGRPAAEIQVLSDRAEALGAATHTAFWNTTTNASYLHGLQTHQVMPLMAGLVPPSLVPVVQQALVTAVATTEGHLDTGLHGTYFLAKILSSSSSSSFSSSSSSFSSPQGGAMVHKALLRNDNLAWTIMTKTTPPSYGALLKAGYTTWPEDWEGASSRIHGCLNGFGLWYPSALLGVQPREDAPGFTAFEVAPAFGVGGLAWAQGTVASPKGPVTVAWTAVGGGGEGGGGGLFITLNLTVPPFSAARVRVHASGPGAVSEGGKPADTAMGITYLGMEGEDTLWEVTSGQYAFSTQ